MPLDPPSALPNVNPLLVAWENQLVDLLLGRMTDQPITIANTLTVTNAFTASSAVTFSASSSGGVLTAGVAGLVGTVAPGSSGNVLTSSGGVWASVAAAAGSAVTIATTTAGGTAMTTAATNYTAVTSSALVNGGVYGISGQAEITDNNVAAGQIACELFDVNNATILLTSREIYPPSLSGDALDVPITHFKYTGTAGTSTLVIRCRSSNNGDTINNAWITVVRYS